MSDNHGNTPAAWTTVTLVLLAFVVGGIGLMVYSWPVFWIGVALAPVGVVAGLVLSKMGHGGGAGRRLHTPEEAQEARRRARDASAS